MAKLEMTKLSILALRKDRRALMRLLQGLGQVQVEKAAPEEAQALFCRVQDEEQTQALADRLTLLQAAIDRLQALCPVKRSMLAQRPTLDGAQVSALEAKADALVEHCGQIRALEQENAALRAAIQRLKAQSAALRPLEGFDLPLEQIQDGPQTHMGLYFVENRQAQALEQAMEERPLAQASLAGRDGEGSVYFLLWHRSLQDMEETLRQLDAKRLSFSEKGTPSQAVEEYAQQTVRLEAQIEQNLQVIASFAPEREDYEAYVDICANALEREKAAELFVGTEQTFLLVGFAEERVFDSLKKTLEERFPVIYVQREPLQEGEAPPVSLSNPPAVKPYEFVTNMFSAPGPNDIDPNAIMMPFFVAFFGMMVSDAGYGVLLSVLALVGLRLFKLKGGIGDIAKILVVGGVLTLFWGALFGTWFGFELPPLMFNPLYEPLKMLILCFALGGIHILCGMTINGVELIKRGQWLDAIGSQFSWFAVFAGLLLMLLPAVSVLGYALIGLGVFLILFFSDNTAGWNVFKRLSAGLGALYGITGFLSDVLSYARLFAMGLATGVIGSVINTIVGMVWGNVFGCIAGVVIFAGGHLFNLAINVLGAYVHASRLQYIEFYGKFYEGGGREFTPLRRVSKYVNLGD